MEQKCKTHKKGYDIVKVFEEFDHVLWVQMQIESKILNKVGLSNGKHGKAEKP